MPKKVMISAGEASGELYGAMLSREIKKVWPDVEIFGIGGPRMEEEGVSLIAPISHVIGLFEAVKHLAEIKKTFNSARDIMVDKKPDLLVLIDYPDFNISLAQRAKEAGIKILYYVSPQVWAWRTGRIKKIASLVDKIAVLFPFEVDYYKNTGLPCEFVGHPIAETIAIDKPKEEIKKELDLDPGLDVLSVLPGSRPGEIRRHLPIITELAYRIRKNNPQMQIVMPLVTGSTLPQGIPDFITVLYGKTTEALACSEAAAVASGTATLQTALIGTPMVVFYSVSNFTFYLMKLLVSIKYVSLVNLLSGREVIRELLQREARPDLIYNELEKILGNSSYRDSMKEDLRAIEIMMRGKKTSERVASIVGEMAGWSRTE